MDTRAVYPPNRASLARKLERVGFFAPLWPRRRFYFVASATGVDSICRSVFHRSLTAGRSSASLFQFFLPRNFDGNGGDTLYKHERGIALSTVCARNTKAKISSNHPRFPGKKRRFAQLGTSWKLFSIRQVWFLGKSNYL